MKWTSLNVLPVLLFCFLATSLFAQVSNYSSNELILRFEEGVSPPEQQAILDEYNLIVLDGPTPLSEFLLCKIHPYFPNLPPGSYPNPLDSINGVIEVVEDQEPEIMGIGLHYEVLTMFTPGGKLPESGVPHPTSNCTPDIFSIDVEPAGLNNTKACIFDTGIAGKPYGNYFKFDFPSTFNPHFDNSNPGVNFLDFLSFPKDDNGHGTHCSGMMVAQTAGNPDLLELRAYKIFNKFGVGKLFNIIKAIDYASLENVKIANMSLSYYAPQEYRFNANAPLRVAIGEALANNGMLVIASAGNRGTNNDTAEEAAFPASFPNDNIISVTSVSCAGSLSDFGNTGTETVDIAALGEDVPGPFLEKEIHKLSGTSMSTAIVARVAAMLANHQSTFDYAKIKCALLNAATPHQSLLAHVGSQGYMDAEDAFDEMMQNCSGNNGGPGPMWAEQLRLANDQEIDALHVNHIVEQEGIRLYIESGKDQAGRVSIFNSLGQLIKSEKISLLQGQNEYFQFLPMDEHLELTIMQLEVGNERYLVKTVR